MQKSHFFAQVLVLVLLAGCGDDMGKRNRNGPGPKGGKKTERVDNNESDTVMSQIHRNRGSVILTAKEEISNILAGTLGTKYRSVPDISIDDEGTPNKNVVTVDIKGRPNTTCGNVLLLGSINNRIKNCEDNNNETEKKRAIWDGGENGAAGEALWKLVYNNDSTGYELWLDTRTGLVWTDVLAMKGNWCMATGNDQDPESANSKVDCSSARQGEEFCKELNVSGLGSNIVWRVPTRNDYLQADLDGIRFIFKAQNLPTWTATVDSSKTDRDHAWTYNAKFGTLSSVVMTNEDINIRCVGAPIR